MTGRMPLRILTFNCSAIPVLTPAVRPRLLRLTAEIRKLDPDLICLQEVGLESYARLLKERLRRWPFSFWERARRGGVVCGGLAVFSKKPFYEACFEPFSRQGPWLGYSLLARMSRKGIMRLKFRDPELELLHAHPVADYSATRRTWTRYAKLQERQVAQLIGRVRSSGHSGRLVVAGDLNFTPDSGSYAAMTDGLGLVDLMEGERRPSILSDREWGASFWIPRRRVRIDYLLVSRDLIRRGKTRAGYVFDRVFRWSRTLESALSDHCGVLGELQP
ncbi:MAG: endonuclease/exonuclease/phosphatase family protein [Elusimicrobia bacterium]|nr:endonuclease/exonuclease/phosphatase family protein [Elusimicrobiota bacterium]